MDYSLARRTGLAACAAALMLLAAACGGASDADGVDEEVATLETVEESDEQALGDTGIETPADDVLAEPTTEEAALAFAECMRAEGLDFPDPTVDADGNPSFAGAFGAGAEGGLNLRGEEGRAAITACQDLTEGFAFGGGGRNAGVDQDALQDALLPYTACLRDAGIDVGDLTLGGGPGAGAGDGAAAGNGDADGDRAGAGRPAGGQGGDPGDRIAGTLGIDAEDPDTAAAMATCEPLLEEAFSAFGPGAEADE